MNGGLAAALDIHPRRRYTAHKRQSDKSAAAHIEFCSVLASFGVYTEFGIEPFTPLTEVPVSFAMSFMLLRRRSSSMIFSAVRWVKRM